MSGLRETLSVIEKMERDGIIGRYAIGGAVGAIYYIHAPSTEDVDIFATLPTRPGSRLLDLSPVYTYLQDKGYKSKKEGVLIGTWPVQFLAPADSLEEEAIEKAEAVDVEGVKTWVMPAEHLVAIALKTGRAKDHARIVEFLKQKAVNKEKLKRVLSKHGLTGKWQAFEKKYPAQ